MDIWKWLSILYIIVCIVHAIDHVDVIIHCGIVVLVKMSYLGTSGAWLAVINTVFIMLFLLPIYYMVYGSPRPLLVVGRCDCDYSSDTVSVGVSIFGKGA